MERLTKKELLTLLEFIKERYSIRDVEIFKQRVLSRLAEIIQSNIRRYNELGPPPARKNRTNGTQRRCSASAADPLICDIQKNPPYNHHRNKPEVAHEHSSRSGLSGKFHRTLGVSHRTAVRSATESKPNHGTSHLTKHNE